ncbi:MAG: hypothetical protein IIY58_01880 [Aeriscardovia sp.]|nr:hypothetical protein [Aeriscardovia sp.]
MTDAERALLLAKENRDLKLKLAQKEEELRVAADNTPTIEIGYVIYLRNKVDELTDKLREAEKKYNRSVAQYRRLLNEKL